ncbi:MAG: hypothetical protein DRJ47_00455 [Thermoprotei archaeon]|nr:MAG: hypothetical protein DRJ47_00455 [Thermoprotei archaeon]
MIGSILVTLSLSLLSLRLMGLKGEYDWGELVVLLVFPALPFMGLLGTLFLLFKPPPQFPLILGLLLLPLALKFRPKIKLEKNTLYPLISIITIHSLLWILYFYKYPILHSFLMSHDPIFHMLKVKQLSEGTFPAGRYPLTLHFTALFYSIEWDYNPAAVRYFVGAMELLAPLLTYSVGKRLFSKQTIGYLVSTMYSLVYVPASAHIYFMGTYPNFYEEIQVLFILFISTLLTKTDTNIFNLILIPFYSIYALSVHWFSSLFFTALTVSWLIEALYRRFKLDIVMLKKGLLFAAPSSLLVLFVRPNFVVSVLSGHLRYSESLDPLFLYLKNRIPYLAYLISEATYVPSFLALLALAYVFIRLLTKREEKCLFPILLWVVLCALPPFFMKTQPGNTPRFVVESLIPLSLLLGYFLGKIYDFIEKNSIQKEWKIIVKTLFLIFICIIVTFSPFRLRVYDIADGFGRVHDIYTSVYDSMLWLKTKGNATVVSIVLPHYRYLPIFSRCKLIGDYYANASQAITLNADYIVVAKYYRYYDMYTNHSKLILVYENKWVAVFERRK